MGKSLTPAEADWTKGIEENLKNEQSIEASRRKQSITPNLRVGKDFSDRVQASTSSPLSFALRALTGCHRLNTLKQHKLTILQIA